MIRATVYLWPHVKCYADMGFGGLTVKTEALEPDTEQENRWRVQKTDYFSWRMLAISEEEARTAAWTAMSGEELFEKELKRHGHHYLAFELTPTAKSYETFLEDFHGGPFGDILRYRDFETLLSIALPTTIEKYRKLRCEKELRCSHSVWLILKAMGYPLAERAWLSITPHALMRELLAPYRPSLLQPSVQSPPSLPETLKVASPLPAAAIDPKYQVALEELTKIRLYKKVFRREGQSLERAFRLSHREDYPLWKVLSSMHRLSLYEPNGATSRLATTLLINFRTVVNPSSEKAQRDAYYSSCLRELQQYLKNNRSRVHVKMMLLNILLAVLTLGVANVVNYARVQRFTVFRDVSARTKFLKIEKQLKTLKPMLESGFKAVPG